jgi:hypothetical protein
MNCLEDVQIVGLTVLSFDQGVLPFLRFMLPRLGFALLLRCELLLFAEFLLPLPSSPLLTLNLIGLVYVGVGNVGVLRCGGRLVHPSPMTTPIHRLAYALL